MDTRTPIGLFFSKGGVGVILLQSWVFFFLVCSGDELATA